MKQFCVASKIIEDITNYKYFQFHNVSTVYDVLELYVMVHLSATKNHIVIETGKSVVKKSIKSFMHAWKKM